MTSLGLDRIDGLASVQDMGRPGHLAQGLARGGAMDRLALIEAAALLGAPAPLPAIEMAGAGGIVTATAPMRVALTGAPMAAFLDEAPLAWQASHLLAPGQRLRIGAAREGAYGYLTPAGEIATPLWLGSRAAHLSIGFGAPLQAGQTVPCGPDPDPHLPPRRIEVASRFQGGTIRIMDGPQTALFAPATRAAFLATGFRRALRGNRQGVLLEASARFASDHAAGLASDMIGPGDLQMTGDGVPYVLLAECQTIGGYPRIGTVIAADLPRIAQAAPGASIRFQRLSLDHADALYRDEAALLAEARTRCRDLVRDPASIPDLLSYQLVGGVTAGHDTEES